MFCGVCVSQSFSGFHFSVDGDAAVLQVAALNGLLVNWWTT